MNEQIYLFVYGTLMDQEFVENLVRKRLDYSHAKLYGFEKISPSNSFPYSYIIPRDGCEVEGMLIKGLDANSLKILDKYEGVDSGLYRRILVQILTNQGKIKAYTYAAGERLLKQLKN
ncbi:MAG: gamma-glutamylcyclotransferase family protein [Candidatus Jordarchaeaceae archaeon]